jgi:phosphopentomutase
MTSFRTLFDMKDLEDNITNEMDVIKGYIQEKLNSYRENVNRPDYIAGSGIHTDCFEDIAAMGRQMLLVNKAMQIGTELGIRQSLHDDKKQTLMELQLSTMSTKQINENYTKKVVRRTDGSRGYILVPKKRMLANTN